MPSLPWMTTVFWATIRATPFLVYGPPSWDVGWPLSVPFLHVAAVIAWQVLDLTGCDGQQLVRIDIARQLLDGRGDLGRVVGIGRRVEDDPEILGVGAFGNTCPALGNWEVDRRRARCAVGDRRLLDVVFLDVVGDRLVGTRTPERTSREPKWLPWALMSRSMSTCSTTSSFELRPRWSGPRR